MKTDSVLIITEVFSPEEFLINDIAKKWVAEGKNVKVLTRNPAYPFGVLFKGYKNKLYSKSIEHGITIYRYHIIPDYKNSKFRKITNYIWNTLLASTLALVLHRKNKNIFIYHTGPLTVALPGVLLKLVNRGRATIWTQDVWPDVAFAYGVKKNGITIWAIESFVNFIYKNCNKVITTSRPVQKDVEARIKRKPYFIPNWPGSTFQQQSTSYSIQHEQQPYTFTFAGNIGVMQNLEIIIQSFHLWAQNRTDVVLNIYGDGSAKEGLERIISDQKITNVHLKGRVPMDQIPAIYEASDVLLISLREDKVLEKYVPAKFSTYLVAGKPIFGVLAGAVKDYIQEGNIGYVAAASDTKAISKGFEYFLQLTQEDKDKIKSNALELYRSEFDADMNYQKLTSLVFDS